MAHTGKTLFISVQPSGIKVHNYIALKPNSRKHMPTPPSTQRQNKVIMDFVKLFSFVSFFFFLAPLFDGCSILMNSNSCFCSGAVCASPGGRGCLCRTRDQHITSNLCSWPHLCFDDGTCFDEISDYYFRKYVCRSRDMQQVSSGDVCLLCCWMNAGWVFVFVVVVVFCPIFMAVCECMHVESEQMLSFPFEENGCMQNA